MFTIKTKKIFKKGYDKFSEAFEKFDDFFEDMDFEEMFEEASSLFSPSVNISQNENAINIEISAPGQTKEVFDISLEDDILVVGATVEEDKTTGSLFFGSFKKKFKLPSTIDPDSIVATYEAGVLGINILKKKEDKKPSIKVNVH